MTMRARVLAVVVLGNLSGLWTGPASGQILPDGFSSQTASDLGGGLTGYDAAGNLYLLRPSWVTSSGQATLERISPSGERAALSVPVSNAQNMAVAPDGRLFVIGWDGGNQLVRRDTDGTVTTLLTAGANEYFNGVALTTAGTLVVSHNVYDGTAQQWRSSVAVVSSNGTIASEITTSLEWANAVRADRSGNVLALGWIPPDGESSQWTTGLVRVNPETGETSLVSRASSGFQTYPADVAVDPAGQTLLSLFNGGILARRSESGSVSTVSSDSWFSDVASNTSGSAVFTQGWKWDGNTSEQVIQRVEADGTLTTVLAIPQNSSSSTWFNHLAVDANGTLYGARYQNTGGAYAYDIVQIADGTATSLAGSESSTYINGLAVDNDGKVVFSRSDGIFRLTGDGTLTKLANPRTGYDRVRINPATGQVFVGGWDAGLAVLDEATGTFTAIPLTGADGRAATRIHDFTFDRDGNLILSVEDRSGSLVVRRLYRVSAQGGTLALYDVGVSGAFWTVPAFDANGNVWFSTGESSIQYVNADGTLTPAITGILGWNPFFLTFAPDGTLLLSAQWGSTGDSLLITGFGAEIAPAGGGSGGGATAVPAVPAWALLMLAALLGRVVFDSARHPRRQLQFLGLTSRIDGQSSRRLLL